MSAVTIIGINDNGCVGLSAKAYSRIQSAQVLVGGNRHLEFFHEFEGVKISFQEGMIKTIEKIKDYSQENNVVVLASGDPFFYGVGDLVAKKVGHQHIETFPTNSSVHLAFSRIGVKWDDACIISLHGKPIKGLINKISDQSKVALLTDKKNTPEVIAKYLLEFGEKDWVVNICENLEGESEKITSLPVSDVKGEFSDLNVLILIRDKKQPRSFTVHPEELFQKRVPQKGLITKKEVRALALMNLNINENTVMWDIGAGSGSVAIEAARIAKNGTVHAIEVDQEGVGLCHENIKSFKTDNVEVICAMAPEGLDDLPDPDAIFIGGSKGKMEEIIECSYKRLKNGGVLVISAILLDSVGKIQEVFKKMDVAFEVQLIQISRSKKIAHYLRYTALNPIHLFTAKKEL